MKIGWALDPQKRLKQLQTGSSSRLHILATLPGGRDVESRLHAKFTHQRRQGEWFDFGGDEPVRQIVRAWLEIQPKEQRPSVVEDTPKESSVWDDPEYDPGHDTLDGVRKCFVESGKDFLSLTELHRRMMELEGLHWWKHEQATEWSIQCHVGPWAKPANGGYLAESFFESNAQTRYDLAVYLAQRAEVTRPA